MAGFQRMPGKPFEVALDIYFVVINILTAHLHNYWCQFFSDMFYAGFGIIAFKFDLKNLQARIWQYDFSGCIADRHMHVGSRVQIQAMFDISVMITIYCEYQSVYKHGAHSIVADMDGNQIVAVKKVNLS